jgi:hypothetical protein
MKEESMNKTSPNYRVGYGRPPTEHQFRPGQSGNPAGRPKGARSFKSDLRDELSELVSISDGTSTVEMTKQRAIIKTLLRMAIAGDPEAPEDRAIMQAVGVYPPKSRKSKSASMPALGKDETP